MKCILKFRGAISNSSLILPVGVNKPYSYQHNAALLQKLLSVLKQQTNLCVQVRVGVPEPQPKGGNGCVSPVPIWAALSVCSSTLVHTQSSSFRASIALGMGSISPPCSQQLSWPRSPHQQTFALNFLTGSPLS